MLLSSFVIAQQSEQKIAYKYYVGGEYSKAVSIYRDINSKQFSIGNYYPYYISLINIQRYDEAEKLAKKAYRKYPNNDGYRLEIAIAQLKNGEVEKANKVFDKVFEKNKGKKNQTINLANTFIRYQMYEQALKMYLVSEGANPKLFFNKQKAQVYAYLAKTNLMIAEYLIALKRNPRERNAVTQQIQRFLDNDGIKSNQNYKLVKKLLLPHVRAEESRTDFSEILIWLFMQNHQFELAFKQAKSLNKRKASNGEGILDLALVFLENKYYDLAVQAYDFVIDKGKNNPLFIEATISKLYALTKSLNDQYFTVSDVDAAYQNAISDLGKNKNTVLLFSNYAHFKAFYLHDLEVANSILLEAMGIPNVLKTDLASCKLEYADVMLLMGNVWESLLYYSQVEMDFKENPIGHFAKFKRAKISYFQGNFNWAQAQLSTLKASTSKLIANDAMQLSLLITDNLNLDTSELAMQLFAKADLLSYQQQY